MNTEKPEELITREAFEDIVSQAIDNIPELFQENLDNVLFKVEEAPSPEQREKLRMRPYDGLYGLYEGVPLNRRSGVMHGVLPDVITIFMHPMLRHFTNKEDLKKQIFETVWHEVAHYYGLSHEDMHRITDDLDS